MAGPPEKLKHQETSAASNKIKTLTNEKEVGDNNKIKNVLLKKAGTSEEQTPRVLLTTATPPLVASLSRVEDLELAQNQDTKQKKKQLSPKTKQLVKQFKSPTLPAASSSDKNDTLPTLDLNALDLNALQTLNRENTQSSLNSPPSFFNEYDDVSTSKSIFAPSATLTQGENQNVDEVTLKEEEEEGGTDTTTKKKTSAVTEFFMGQDNNGSNRGDSIASMSAAHNKNKKKINKRLGGSSPKSPTVRHRSLSLTKDAGEDASTSSAGDSFGVPIDPAVTTNDSSLLVPLLLSSHQLSLKKKNKKKKPARPPGAVKRRSFLAKKKKG